MNRLRLIGAVLVLALAFLGFNAGKAYSQNEPHGVVCFVGRPTMGPNEAIKAMYFSPNVDVIVDQTYAECEKLTSGDHN